MSPRSLAQLCPKTWVNLPDGLGHICSSSRLCLLMYVGMDAIVRGLTICHDEQVAVASCNDHVDSHTVKLGDPYIQRYKK